jgi:hypothetical protein
MARWASLRLEEWRTSELLRMKERMRSEFGNVASWQQCGKYSSAQVLWIKLCARTCSRSKGLDS